MSLEARDLHAHRLHDKSTRGEPLTPEERAQLESWYDRMDREERLMFEAAAAAGRSDDAPLRRQVDAALGEWRAASRRVEAMAAEVDATRAEVAALKQHLASLSRARSA